MNTRNRAAPRIALTVQFAACDYTEHRAQLPRPLLRRWVKASLATDAELTLRFIDNDEARELNHTYRGRDYPTNVLTFAYAASASEPISGDIVLCCPVIDKEATEQNKPLLAHYAHLIVHGVLHAQGYDHEQEDDAQEMEAREVEILAQLGFPNPYKSN
jgi:probable rRNA maturation factor